MAQLNVAFIGNQIAFGGGATSFYLLIKSLRDKPIKKFVFASQIQSLEMKKNFEKYCEVVEKIQLDQVKSSQTSKTSAYERLKAQMAKAKQVQSIIAIINKYNIDILHFNNSVFSHLYQDIKKESNVKIVTHVREMIESNTGSVPREIVSYIGKYSDHIITISDNEKTAFPNNTNVTVVANPFDFKTLEKEHKNLRTDWGVTQDTLVVCMLGRFAKSKGHLLFLEVLEKLKAKRPSTKFKFLIAGIAPRKPYWKRLVKLLLFRKDFGDIMLERISKSALSSHLILLPYTSDVFSVINSVNIIVRPSLFNDPWGRDIIESMALGKPIIATGTSQFYIKDKVNGQLVQPNSDSVLKAVERYLDYPNEMHEAANRNSKDIRDKCDINLAGKMVHEVYLTL